MNHYQYACSISDLFTNDSETIVGNLAINNDYDSGRKTIESWNSEIKTLRIALNDYKNETGVIAFEYTIPRIDGRIDCVVLLRNLVFILEFKTGESAVAGADKHQLEQYVKDLKHFHFESYDAPIVPMWITPSVESTLGKIQKPTSKDMVFKTITVSDSLIASAFNKILSLDLDEFPAINHTNWLHSPYCPTSNIVDAARKLYSNHTVNDINRSDAKGSDLIRTTEKLLSIIEQAKLQQKKYLCLVTGVPGAGKTLIGLSVATRLKNLEGEKRSVYLSGNRPLVTVLQAALADDAHKRKKAELDAELNKITDKKDRIHYKKTHKIVKAESESEVKQFIQLVPNWRKEYLKGIKVIKSNDGDYTLIKDNSYPYNGEGDWFIPYDHVSIYDEAQRAWQIKENAEYVRKKESHLKDFPDWSEPRFLISCMDRHPDWAVYICLIGNGQDINHGEAGTVEWLKAIKFFPEWEIYAPNDLRKLEDTRDEVLSLHNIQYDDDLHLTSDLRSIRAENLAKFVNALLNIKTQEASNILSSLDRYPIRLTRDLNVAKQWVKNHAHEEERYGALASSKGQRLKPDGLVLLPTNSDKTVVKHWFLGDKKLVSSSFYMEDVATEFQVQGLEVDWALVAWDADLRMNGDQWQHFRFKGSRWENIRKDEDQRYQINAYRVILTRARRGMVIYVPRGNNEDHTRKTSFYDSTYMYLKSLGIKEI